MNPWKQRRSVLPFALLALGCTVVDEGADDDLVENSEDDAAGGAPDETFVPPEVLWADDFEGKSSEWSVEGGLWEVGLPAFEGGPVPLSGSKLAGATLSGSSQGGNARLISPEFQVPSASDTPRFKYAFWHDLGPGHYGQVEVSIDGREWRALPADRLILANGGWAQRVIPLREYAGQRVRIGLHLGSQDLGSIGPTGGGWYIDDAALETGDMLCDSPGGFEVGMGDWSVEGGLWSIGEPALEAGPMPATGLRLAGTNLRGTYGAGQESRLVTPEVLVPRRYSKFRFEYSSWHEVANGDAGQVQISLDGGAWTDLPGHHVSGASSGWSRDVIPLSGYVGRRVRLGLRLVTDTNTVPDSLAPGWYVDDASFEMY